MPVEGFSLLGSILAGYSVGNKAFKSSTCKKGGQLSDRQAGQGKAPVKR